MRPILGSAFNVHSVGASSLRHCRTVITRQVWCLDSVISSDYQLRARQNRKVIKRVQELWIELAGVPVSFPPAGGLAVVVSGNSRLCPPGWVGIIKLGAGGIATVPSTENADILMEALHAGSDLGSLCSQLPTVGVLGPATLAYLDEPDFRPVPSEVVESGVHDLSMVSGPEDFHESALDEITSPLFVIRHEGAVIAASGYRHWPTSVAHMSVLTAPAYRGKGLARTVASSAVAHALSSGLMPQWRARPEPSRRVARALGFRELGEQISVRLADG